jgi:hypothetical protein
VCERERERDREMGRTQKGRVADLSRSLQRGTASLRETVLLLNDTAPIEGVKGDWGEVKKVAEQVAKHATTIGMLWAQGVKVEDANQALKTYFDCLQGLLLLCHGCTVGAGPTLLVTIRNAAQQVLDASLTLLTRAVSFSIKGAEKQECEAVLPALVGCVWEACNTLKKTPFTNRGAIGRSLAQVATSVKDVLREIKEMREGRSSEHNACDCGHDHGDATRNEAGRHRPGHSHSHDHSGHDHCSHDHSHDLHSHDHSGHGHCGHDHTHSGHNHGHEHSQHHSHNHPGHSHCEHENDGHRLSDNLSHSHDHSGHEHCGHGDEETSNGDGDSGVESLDFNEQLSEEEIAVVEAAKGVVDSSLGFIKQLLYVAAEMPQDTEESSTVFLEDVLKHCKGLGAEMDEFGASLYPPQETNQLRDSIVKMEVLVDQINTQVRETRGSLPEGLDLACKSLQNAKVELTQTLGGL